MNKRSKTDMKKLKRMRGADVDFSDIPELGSSFFAKAKIRLPRRKSSVSIRLDSDVLGWFKRQGRGYQTRINAILRMYMEAKAH